MEKLNLQASSLASSSSIFQPTFISSSSIDPRKLLVQPRDNAPQFFNDPVGWLLFMQQKLSRDLARTLRNLGEASPLKVGWTLVLIGFAYGVLHAAGPGHGKAVVSLWVLGQKQTLREGVFIAFSSALLQAIVAISAVSFLILGLGLATSYVKHAAFFLERVSFLLIALVGGILVFQAFRQFFQKTSKNISPCACGHAPSPPDLQKIPGFLPHSSFWLPVLSAGIRPCLGALLILVAAYSIGIYWAGILAVFAMALGTALTVSTLVILAVFLQQACLQYFERGEKWLKWGAFFLKVSAGLILVFFGMSLFFRSITGGQ